jgi:hypothetical protein
MKAVYTVLLVLLLAGAGLGLGWAFLPRSETPAGPCEVPPLVTASHRFSLTTEDEKSDRERPALAVNARGQVLLAWSSQTAPDEYTIFLAHSEDAGKTFDKPAAFRKVPIQRYRSFMRGKEVTRPTVALPRLAAHGNRFLLGWLAPSTSKEPKAPVQFWVAHSEDGGRTFSSPAALHEETTGRPNFTALKASPDGTPLATWLDRHQGSQKPFFGRLPEGTKAGPGHLVYAPEKRGVCPCCDTDVLCSPDGTTFVAFRNADSGFRDIVVCRSRPNGGFEAPVGVSPDHWIFGGCPHDGPSLACSKDRLHVLWMDAHDDRQRVYLASSPLEKLTFTHRLVSPESAGDQCHPRLAAGVDGALHAVWSENLSPPPTGSHNKEQGNHQHGAPAGSNRCIQYSHSADGTSFKTPVPLVSSSGVYQVRPEVALGPQGPVVAWMETTNQGKCVVCVQLNPAGR